VNTKKSTVPIDSHSVSSSIACNYVKVNEGDVVVLTGKGGGSSNYLFYALVEKVGDSYNKISASPLNVDYTVNPLLLTIPSGVTHIVINWYDYNTYGGSCTIYSNIDSLADYPKIDELYNRYINRFVRTEYGQADLLDGYVNSNWEISTGSFKYLQIEIPKHSSVTVNSVGGSSARMYRRKDIYGNELSAAPSNMDTMFEAVTLDYSGGGLLAVNCNSSYSSAFKVVVTTDTSITEDNHTQPHYINNPLQIKDTIKILGIGNSYLAQSTSYISDMLSNANVDDSKYCVYIATSSGKGLDFWASDTPPTPGTCMRVAGSITMSGSGTIDNIIAQDWDLIVLQQYSNDAVDYGTFNPYLTKLIAKIRQLCLNQNVCIGFNMSWPYANGSLQSYGGYPYGVNRYNLICDATKKMVLKDGVDFIIPTGTAIENVRATSLNNDYDLSIDGTHLSYGVPRYIASAVWVQMVFSHIFNVNILNSTLNTSLTSEELATNGAEDVTDNNRTTCLQCAFWATISMYDITEFS
jgi:hypothetical protein